MEEQKSKDLKMFEYTFTLVSKLNGLPLTIESVILARDYQDADRLFYWKILTEFTPYEYANIVLDGVLDRCESKESEWYKEDCHRGIVDFRAIFDGSLIRSLERSLLNNNSDMKRGNLHSGIVRVSTKRESIPFIYILALIVFISVINFICLGVPIIILISDLL